jgi:D-galactose 1-dehydrogenase
MRSSTIRIALVGLGKIARDQHCPALAALADFELLAGASPHSRIEGLPWYRDLETLLREVPIVTAVSLCTTPQVRFDIARYALQQGRDVLLEKPPGMTVNEVTGLVRIAEQKSAVLFASWHSRHACAVQSARAWLAGRTLREIRINWKEDVRVWHPGQSWIWQAGGLGVFDPGINALSILTYLLPGNLVLRDADLSYPENCETPIAARVLLADSTDTPVHMELDFLHPGAPRWDIEVETGSGRLLLSRGGKLMTIDDRPVETPPSEEYVSLYAHFADLVHHRRNDVDLAPLQLVADAFLCGRRNTVAPFIE